MGFVSSMKKFTWTIEATEFEIQSILKACEKENIHELCFWKTISEAVNCPKCGLVIKGGDQMIAEFHIQNKKDCEYAINVLKKIAEAYKK